MATAWTAGAANAGRCYLQTVEAGLRLAAAEIDRAPDRSVTLETKANERGTHSLLLAVRDANRPAGRRVGVFAFHAYLNQRGGACPVDFQADAGIPDRVVFRARHRGWLAPGGTRWEEATPERLAAFVRALYDEADQAARSA